MDKPTRFDNRFSFARLSFSKGKLKKTSEIAGVSSPIVDKKVNKEDAKSAKKLEKERLRLKYGSLDAESIPTKQPKSNFFRTPSLPRRLKFKSSDLLTPKKSMCPSPDNAAQKNVFKCATKPASSLSQLYSKFDTNKEALEGANREITNLKTKIHFLEETIRRQQEEKEEVALHKDRQIRELEREMKNLNLADELLQKIAEKSLDKIKSMEVEMKNMLRSHEAQLDGLTKSKLELEMKFEEIFVNYQATQEENSTLRFENQFLRQELGQYQSMVQLQANELNAKIEEIRFLEKSMEEIMEESQAVKEQVQRLKIQAEEDILRYIEDTRNTVQESDALKRERSNLLLDLKDKQELINALHDELAEKQVEIDAQNDEMRETYNYEINIITEKYEERINKMQETYEIKLQEAESVYVLERSKLVKDHSELIARMNNENDKEITRINETAEETIKIAEVQAEERVKALEASIQSMIAKEKSLWQSEMDKCQKIAETEIIKCELEKRELKNLIEATNQLLKERDDMIQEFETNAPHTFGPVHKVKEDCERKLKEAQKEAAKLKTEKYNYQLTLSNTRSTVNILMERLKRSDGDVEILKAELDEVTATNVELEANNIKLSAELEDYKKSLTALTQSSRKLEQQMCERNQVYEQLMNSEQEAIAAVTQIGTAFTHKVEESMTQYVEMYEDMKRKYEVRESHIKNMKTLLDDFTTSVELARVELDAKDKKLFELEQENKDIKLESMTYKFKCEQFERYQKHLHTMTDDDDNFVSNKIIENIIIQLDKEDEIPMKSHASETKSNEEKLEILNEIISNESNKIIEENQVLKERIHEQEERLRIVEEFAQETSKRYKELLDKMENENGKPKDGHLKEINTQLKMKISKLQDLNKKQESTIVGLQEQIDVNNSPHKMNLSAKFGSPKTPKTPKNLMNLYPGKENRSPATTGMSPKNILKPRNN